MRRGSTRARGQTGSVGAACIFRGTPDRRRDGDDLQNHARRLARGRALPPRALVVLLRDARRTPQALRRCSTPGLEPASVAGSSARALVGKALWAAGLSVETMKAALEAAFAESADVLRVAVPWRRDGLPPEFGGVFSSAATKRVVQSIRTRARRAATRLEHCRVPAAVSVFDVGRLKTVVVREGPMPTPSPRRCACPACSRRPCWPTAALRSTAASATSRACARSTTTRARSTTTAASRRSRRRARRRTAAPSPSTSPASPSSTRSTSSGAARARTTPAGRRRARCSGGRAPSTTSARGRVQYLRARARL